MEIKFKNNFLELTAKPFFTKSSLDFSIDALGKLEVEDPTDQAYIECLRANLKIKKEGATPLFYQDHQLHKITCDVLSQVKKPKDIISESEVVAYYSRPTNTTVRELFYIANYGFEKNISNSEIKLNEVEAKSKNGNIDKFDGSGNALDGSSYIYLVEENCAYKKLNQAVIDWKAKLSQNQINNLKQRSEDVDTLNLLMELKEVIENCRL